MSGSVDGTVVWSAGTVSDPAPRWLLGNDDADLIAHACEHLPRDLSPGAIKRFNLDPDAPWPCAERAKTLWPHPVAAATAPPAGTEEDAGAAAPQ